MQVLDQDHARPVTHVRGQQRHHGVARLAPQLLRVGNGRAGWPRHRQSEQLTEQLNLSILVGSGPGEQLAQPRQVGLGAGALAEAGLLLEPPDDGVERCVLVLGGGLQPDDRPLAEAGLADQLQRQPGFADPGLAGDLHRLSATGLGRLPELQQLVDLTAAADHGEGIAARLASAGAALAFLAQDLEGLHLARQSLERMHAERAQLKFALQQPLRLAADHERVRATDLLQPEGDIGSITDDLGGVVDMTGARLADHRHPCVHPDAHAQGLLDRGDAPLLQSLDGLQQGEACAHGGLGLVLRGEGVAELAADAVADVVHDGAAGVVDAPCADRLELEQDLAQVLRVATLGQACGIDNIAEQNGELAALTRLHAKVVHRTLPLLAGATGHRRPPDSA